ncbi:CID domain-containing protein [Tanacetum coccineum]
MGHLASADAFIVITISVRNLYMSLRLSDVNGTLQEDLENLFGSQRYAATWTRDNLSTWEHVHLSISMVLTPSVPDITVVKLEDARVRKVIDKMVVYVLDGDVSPENEEIGATFAAGRSMFEDMMRALTLERIQIKEAMGFALDNVDAAREIVEVLTESLTLKETPKGSDHTITCRFPHLPNFFQVAIL